jgi:hypothetical protein
MFNDPEDNLTNFDCRSEQDLKSAITSIFNEIDKETLVVVSASWIEYLKWVIQKKRRYSHK